MAKRSRRRPPSKRGSRTAKEHLPAALAPPRRPTAPHDSGGILLPFGPPALIELVEDPHAHAVCRSCARIASLELTQDDLGALEQLAGRGPDGWVVDGVTFTLTGSCPQCRAESRA